MENYSFEILNVLYSLPCVLRLVFVCLIGYILGSSNMAYYLGKLKGINMRESGTGNLGTSNTMLMLGAPFAVLTFLHDSLKVVLSVFIAKIILPENEAAAYAAGVLSVLGHIFPFWLKFHGGKGFASFLGLVLAFDWKFFLVLFAVTAVLTILTDHIIYGTVAITVAYPLSLYYANKSGAAAIVLIATTVILLKHRENFARLRHGDEIGIRQGINNFIRKN